MFSCVIPVIGARPYFKDALASIQNQGVDVEIIVQDGDVTSIRNEELGIRNCDGLDICWYKEADTGQSDALNRGFSKAKGEWLFWLNADDVLLPDALSKVLDRISRIDRINWIAGDTVYMDENGIVKDVRTDAKWRPWYGKHLSVWTGGPSAFFKRSLWERLGGFDTSLKYVMDIDLWTRWAQAGNQFASVNDYLWGFRVHSGSATMGGMNDDAHRAEKAAVLARHGITQQWFWRNLTRAASILDGSWAKRKLDSYRMMGRHWQECLR